MTDEHDRRVSELFLRAARLAPEKQAALLEKVGRDDPSIVAEVTSLLQYHDPESITDLPAGELARQRLEASLGRGQRPLPGRLLPAWHTTSGRRRISVAAIGVAMLLAVAGLSLTSLVRQRLADSAASQLTAVHDANSARVSKWFEDRRQLVAEWASKPEIRGPIADLVVAARGRDITAEEVINLPANTALNQALEGLLARVDILGANALNREGVLVSYGPGDTRMIGARRLSSEGGKFLQSVFLGETVITPPFVTGLVASLAGQRAEPTTPYGAPPAPRVVAAAPVRDEEGNVMATLGLRIAAVAALTEALEATSLPPGSASYAFDGSGFVVTETGESAELRALGLIPDLANASSPLALQLRDPGGDLRAGFSPQQGRPQLPLTRMAASATSGASGVDVDGYRDVYGQYVVGAWTWLPEFRVGIATEIPYDQAYVGLNLIAFLAGLPAGLFLLLAVYGLATTISWPTAHRPVVEARRLGRYRLEEQIGEGGMSTVYRASHAMLHRPTAIKLLKGDRIGDDDIARFEREVQLVARLNHPNTVQIFDYGQTDSGTLFFVMEYVPGMTLSELVRTDGPQAPARVIAILRQMAGSLREAHNNGIVHRDIKPGNVMICERSDGADIVKVLDFGLARTLEGSTQRITRHDLLGGTPAYIAPERIRQPTMVSPRSDIYSFGATAYYLLTGREVVEGVSAEEVLLRTLNLKVPRVSAHAPVDVPDGLEGLIGRCVESEPSARPHDIDEILTVLGGLATEHPWSEEAARSWWEHRIDRAGERLG